MVLQNTAWRAQDSSLTTAWVKYTWNFTAAETSPQLKMHYFQTGTIWLDDIRVEAVSTNPVGITTNSVTVTLDDATSPFYELEEAGN